MRGLDGERGRCRLECGWTTTEAVEWRVTLAGKEEKRRLADSEMIKDHTQILAVLNSSSFWLEKRGMLLSEMISNLSRPKLFSSRKKSFILAAISLFILYWCKILIKVK